MGDAALVLFSGGQDSTTCLALAKQQYKKVYALTINYGQRHQIEVESAIKTARALGVADDEHEILYVGQLLKGASPLVSFNEVPQYDPDAELPDGVAPTFIPSRNSFFLTIASNRAFEKGVKIVMTGVNETDGSGYPDCRRPFIDAIETALSLSNYGEWGEFQIITPLMALTKAETVQLALRTLGEEKFNEVFQHTHSCYLGIKGGCSYCAACILRDRGFVQAGINDPIWKFRKSEPVLL